MASSVIEDINFNFKNHNSHESELSSQDISIHSDHCRKCFNLNKCTQSHACNLVQCVNNCGFVFHACKTSEHLNETCSLALVDCLNLTNGCKLKIKRCDMSKHLMTCVACVVRCGSFRVRKIMNKNEKFNHLKWPDPIWNERLNILNNNCHSFVDLNDCIQLQTETKNINNVLLDQDIASLREFADKHPLKFHRMYGYLIGLKVFKDYSQSKFSFMKYLLKNVKSKVFKDIETENCIVWNDEDGCAACQSRIRMLESARFAKLKEDRLHFGAHLRDVLNFDEFLEKKVYAKFEFKQDYKEFYLKPIREEEEEKSATQKAIEPDDEQNQDELYKKLLANNQELLNVIELDKTLKLNVAQELPCEAFQLQYESYRTKDTHFCIDCDQNLRREEYSSHYSLYHNFLLSSTEQIHLACPMQEYGCSYFKQTVEFFYGSNFLSVNSGQDNYMFKNGAKKINQDYPSAKLVENKQSKSLTFNMDYLKCKNENDYSKSTILDLPFEVIYEIFDHLDSLSLFNLSMTSKTLRQVCENFLQLRGIVYPKWTRSLVEEKESSNQPINNHEIIDELDEKILNENIQKSKNSKPKYKWRIEKYAYSFSKNIENPTSIQVNTKIGNDHYRNHVQNCPFKITKVPTKEFKIFPPFSKEKKAEY